MSRTKRNDYRKQEGKRGENPFVCDGKAIVLPETPEWKHTRDKKRWNKSPKWFKQMKERNRRAERNQELKNLRAGHSEPEEVNSPKEPKENDWDWT